MPTVYINGQRAQLRATDLIGKGGEADIYDIGNGQVLKLYKQPNDPDYLGNTEAQQAASERLIEQQQKLPTFSSLAVPSRIVKPASLAYNKVSSGKITGYTMQYLKNMEVLLKWSDRKYREQGGLDIAQVPTLFQELHALVKETHKAGIVIGDFNDLNVLVDSNNQVYLVDADSMQFGSFLCRTFTSRFLDPLISDGQKLILARPHSDDSDWYAFNVMLFQSLLYVGPYGGVHRPKVGKRLQHDDRVLNRLTVFNPDVIYPKPAMPYDRLPDELLEHFHKVYEADKREEFPLNLLSAMRFTTCSKCGHVHARPVCPVCASPGLVVQTIVRRGSVSVTEVFKTRGQILQVAYQGGKLNYLYHDRGAFSRENDEVVLKGDLRPGLRFRLNGKQTLLAQGTKLFVFSPNEETLRLETDQINQLSIFDSNGANYFWIQGDQLVRSGQFGSSHIGNILPHRTLLWVGKKFGLGFYQAGSLSRAFLFNSEKPGLNDQVKLPHISGQIIDATCAFSDHLAWLMIGLQENGKLVNRCFVIDKSGKLITEADSSQGEDHWLNNGLRGHIASGSSLLVSTDTGIIRLQATDFGINVAQTFPDTEPFVSSNSKLVAGDGGIYVVDNHAIKLLKIK